MKKLETDINYPPMEEAICDIFSCPDCIETQIERRKKV